MPVKICMKNGKYGYKWGDKGQCYIGDDAKDKALKQGRAIESSKSKARKQQKRRS